MEMVVSSPSKKRERDWSSLLPELIGNLRSKLKEYADEVRFRAVCRKWRSAPRARPLDALPSQVPWLCLPSGKSNNSTWYKVDCNFFSLSEGRYYNVKPHGPSKKKFDIPFDGRFIITSTRHHVSLLNPINGSRITLPPLPGRATKVRKASCVKCLDGDAAQGFCVIALGVKRTKKFYVYRSVDGYWAEFCDDSSGSDEDVTYFKRSVIFATGISQCVRYDRDSRTCTPITIEGSSDLTAYIWYKLLMVQSSSGELLMVKWRVMAPEKGFEVFRLVLTEQNPPMWSRVRSIGDDAIFMGYNRVICANASGIDRCRSNCVYFHIKRQVCAVENSYDVFAFDIEDEKVEVVTGSPHVATGSGVTWIVPHLC